MLEQLFQQIYFLPTVQVSCSDQFYILDISIRYVLHKLEPDIFDRNYGRIDLLVLLVLQKNLNLDSLTEMRSKSNLPRQIEHVKSSLFIIFLIKKNLEEILWKLSRIVSYLDFEMILMTIHKMTMYNNYDHA